MQCRTTHKNYTLNTKCETENLQKPLKDFVTVISSYYQTSLPRKLGKNILITVKRYNSHFDASFHTNINRLVINLSTFKIFFNTYFTLK